MVVGMKVVILAGGFGTRISEESVNRPKPMVEIGEQPILWHIMKQYSQYGFNDFIICLGYKQYVIKEYFANYFLHRSDITIDLANNSMQIHDIHSEPWKVTLVDTGLNTMTGGRVKRIQDYVGDEPFFLTYGDGVSNININELLEFHKAHGKLATISMTNVGQKFGVVEYNEDGKINAFREKADRDGSMINIGFMVMEPGVFKYLSDPDIDSVPLEKRPLEQLARDGELMGYIHEGFWKCMDTLRDKKRLEELWQSKNAPWKIWKD